MTSGGKGGSRRKGWSWWDDEAMFFMWSWLKKFSPLPGNHLLLFVLFLILCLEREVFPWIFLKSVPIGTYALPSFLVISLEYRKNKMIIQKIHCCIIPQIPRSLFFLHCKFFLCYLSYYIQSFTCIWQKYQGEMILFSFVWNWNSYCSNQFYLCWYYQCLSVINFEIIQGY